jgi:hypothetical protein
LKNELDEPDAGVFPMAIRQTASKIVVQPMSVTIGARRWVDWVSAPPLPTVGRLVGVSLTLGVLLLAVGFFTFLFLVGTAREYRD